MIVVGVKAEDVLVAVGVGVVVIVVTAKQEQADEILEG